jgi:hypothetical protein
MKKTTLMLAALAVSSAAMAQSWAEAGDAGNLPGTAQVTMGVGDLMTITGNHDANDIDMFAIMVTNPALFFATTEGVTSFDTQLFLFDSTGRGVTYNDDSPGGTTLQSTITGVFVTGPGLYYLAVGQYNADPSSATGLIWNNTPFNTERAPDGPGAADPVISWSAGGTTVSPYQIDLRGAGYATVPEPGTFVAIGIGLAGLALARRRK